SPRSSGSAPRRSSPRCRERLVYPRAMRGWALLGLLCVACQSPPSEGAACVRNSDCAPPLACGHGRCRPACRMNRHCRPGQRCFLEQDGTGTCSLDVETGCASDPGAHPCACNLSCREDQCVTPCLQASDCASDGMCRMDLTHAGTYCFATPIGMPTDGGGA